MQRFTHGRFVVSRHSSPSSQRRRRSARLATARRSSVRRRTARVFSRRLAQEWLEDRRLLAFGGLTLDPPYAAAMQTVLDDATTPTNRLDRVLRSVRFDGATNFGGEYQFEFGSGGSVARNFSSPSIGQWQPQGPGPIQGTQVENIVPNRVGSGAVHAVLAHPTNPDILYIGAVNGGVWKTLNATANSPTWVPQTDFAGSLSIGALAFDPTDPTYNTLVAGVSNYSSFLGVAGERVGVLRTTDGGQTWVNPGSAGLTVPAGNTTSGENISGIAARGNTIVVTSHTNSGGLFRSTDGGATFAPVSGPDFSSPGDDLFDLVVDPTGAGGQRLYTGVEDKGVYRSDDFGATWVKISGPTIDAEMDALLTDPANNNIEFAVHPTTGRLYVAILLSGQPVALYHTNDGDTASPIWTRMDVPVLPITGGDPLSDASNTTPIVITAAGHGLESSNLVLINGVSGNTAANGQFTVTVLDGDRFELRGSTGNGVYTGGGTWTRITTPNPSPKEVDETGAQGRIHFSLTVDPTSEDIVYVGGDRQDRPNPIGDASFAGAVFRGDASLPSNPLAVPSPQWDHLTHDIVAFDPAGGTASGSAPHADSRDMTFDANGDLIEVDDGGVYRRTNPRDNTGDWFSLAGSLATIEFHQLAYDTLSNTLIGGTQDNGTSYQPVAGSAVWDQIFGGDGADVIVDTQTRAVQNESIRYYSAQNLGGFTKTTWDAFGNLVGSVPVALQTVSGDPIDPQFYTPLALNHVDGNRLLFGAANGVYESFDQGETLSQVASGFSINGFSGHAIDYGGFDGATPNADAAYVASISGNVYVRTTPSGPFVATATGGGPIRDVRMDPDDWSTAYALDSDQVFMTDSAGSAWSDITGDLATLAQQFLSLEVVSGLAEAVVVGTNVGVFASLTTALGDWIPLGNGLPHALAWDLDYDPVDDILAVGTMGRGAWTLGAASFLLSGLEPAATIDLASGDLLVSDATIATSSLRLQADAANSRYVVQIADGTLATSIPGATGDGTDTVTVPFSAVTGDVLVDLSGGSDLLTVDLSLGNFPAPLLFDTDGGSLRLEGSSSVTRTTFISTGTDSGSIDVAGNPLIAFTGAAQIVSALDSTDVLVDTSPASESLFIAPAGPQLEDTLVASDDAADVRFRTPTGDLTITGGVGSDFARIFGVHDLAGTSLSVAAGQIQVDGSLYTTGDGAINLVADGWLHVGDQSNLQTVDGPITLAANVSGTATGDFVGITVDDSTIRSTNGHILLHGVGGNEVGGSFNHGVRLSAKTLIESTGSGPAAGTITIIGEGGAAATGNRGIEFGSPLSVVRSLDGDITLIGVGGAGTGDFNEGIIFFGGAVQSLGTGPDGANIFLDGIGGNAVGSNAGVRILGEGSSVTSLDGDVTITGFGAGSGDFNYGIELANGARIESTGVGADAATITLTGQGADANASNRGVQVSGAATRVRSIDGDITITGAGGDGAGNFNIGFIQFAGTVESLGTGAEAAAITLTGTGGAGGSSNYGVQLLGPDSRITAADGVISIFGQGGGSGDFNHGVLLVDQALIESTGTGTAAGGILVDGIGTNGNSTSRGIELDQAPRLTTVDGPLRLIGLAGDTPGGFNDGVLFWSGLVQSSGAGDLLVSGTGNGAFGRGVWMQGGATIEATALGDIVLTAIGAATSDIQVSDANGPPRIGAASGAGTLTIEADTLELDSLDQLAGSGPLFIQPRALETSIGVGGGAGTLNLNDAELANISDGFSQITIGHPVGSGAVDVNSSTFTDPLVIFGGSMAVTELDAGSNSVTLTANNAAITDGGDAGVDVVASDLALVTLGVVGGVGQPGDSLLFNAATLAGDTAASHGDQFLSEVDTVEVLALDAGAGSVWLTAGDFLLAGSTAATTTVIVEGAALLGGEGAVGGPLDVDGAVAPGFSPGVLAAGPTIFADSSTFVVEIAGGTPGSGVGHHDQLVVQGTIVIGANVALDISPSGGFVPAAGQSFTILDNDAADSVSGTFAGLPNGAMLPDFLGSGLDATLTYSGGDGNDIVIAMASINATDFGDAPDPVAGTGAGNYETLAANDGPAHTVVTGLHLGANVDGDDGTLQNNLANADDVDGALPDDEDGVLSPATDLSGTVGAQPTVTLLATNTTGASAALFGWIDYDRDGVFDNATERAEIAVPNGTTDGRFTLTFPGVPSGSAGNTFARFRLSTDPAAANSTGPAADGEVEDYPFAITNVSTGAVAGVAKIASGAGGGPILVDGDLFGEDVTAIGDLDGDGVVDVAVGARDDDTGGASRGAVYVLLLNADGTAKSNMKIAHETNGGPTLADGDGFGRAVAATNDLDGDGVPDLVVGAFGDDTGGTNRGAVYVLLMKPDGTVKNRVKIASSTNGGPGLANGDQFGSSAASLGDLDGDGVADIAVGAIVDATGGSDRGAVHVLLLNADGTAKSNMKIAHQVNGGPTLADGDFFGSSVASPGDLDGDGIADLAVGAPTDSTGGDRRGATYVLLLNADGSARSSVKIAHLTGGGPSLTDIDRFGAAVAAMGDVDGDGVGDLAVGASRDDTGGNDRGAVYIVKLNPDGTAKSHLKIADQANGGPALADSDFFGSSLSSLGDLNGDGVVDLIAGASRDDTGGGNRGAVHVLFLELAVPPTIDVRLVRSTTATDAGGEAAALPDNELWLHEWEPYWAEIWVTTSATSTGVVEVQLSLDYATTLTSADAVEYNTSFTPIGTPVIDDTAGTITGIHATTAVGGLGDDRPVLLARVRFIPTANDEAAVDVAGQSIGPYALTVTPTAASAALDGGALHPADVAGANVALWAVPYDVDDSGMIDFGDFSFFTPVFGQSVSPAEPFSWWADFDRSDLVDFGDFAFFSPNFAKSKPDASLVFPPNYPEAWRPPAPGGLVAPSGKGMPRPFTGDASKSRALRTLSPETSPAAAAVDAAFADDDWLARSSKSEGATSSGKSRNSARRDRGPDRITYTRPLDNPLEQAPSDPEPGLIVRFRK